MKNQFIKYMNLAVKLVVSYVFMFSVAAHAGSYEDFFQAIKNDNPQRIQELLQRGFDPNTPDPLGQLPLVIALSEPSPNVAKALVNAAQIKPNVLNPAGESALMIAALMGNLELAKLLVTKEADINKTGWTPLHYAASKDHVEMIAFLLDNHAYIDAASPNGTTPLMMASMYGSILSVRLLIDQGADASLKNMQNMTALQFAQTGVRPDAIKLLSAIKKQTDRDKPTGSW